VWADSAYRSDEIEEKLAKRGLKSRIHRRAYCNRELSEARKGAKYDALEGARRRRAGQYLQVAWSCDKFNETSQRNCSRCQLANHEWRGAQNRFP
jgi:IS5 family transposase